MTNADLIAVVRAECGKVTSPAELEDADITRQVEWILAEISDKIPIVKLRSFTGQEDVNEYSFHDNTLRIRKVYPSESTSESDIDLGSEIVNQVDRSDYYNWPSLYKINMSRKIRGLPPFKWRQDIVNRKIRIDPAPERDGDTYWYESVEKSTWTLADLPSDFEHLVVLGVTWKALEQVALKRSQLGGIQRAGGLVEYPARDLKEFIDSKKEEFFDTLRLKAKLYGM